MMVICTELLREPLQWLAKADHLTCQPWDAPIGRLLLQLVQVSLLQVYRIKMQHNIISWEAVNLQRGRWFVDQRADQCVPKPHRAGGSRCNPVAACWPSNLQCWHRFDNCHNNYVPLCCHCEIVLYISYVVRTYLCKVCRLHVIYSTSVYGTNLLK